MKPFLTILALALVLASCTENENPTQPSSEIWSLEGYTCTFCLNPDEFVAVPDTTYYYTFRPDSTFSKTLGSLQLDGTFYKYSEMDGREYLHLQYSEAFYNLDRDRTSDYYGTIHFCGQDFEPMLIREDGKLMGSWGACDGPNLVFRKEDNTGNSFIF